MKIRRRRDGRIAVFSFAEEALAPPLIHRALGEVRRLLGAGTVCMVFDLRRINFVSSPGMGFLVRTREEVVAKEGNMVLVAPDAPFRKTLVTLGLEHLFVEVPDEEAAVRYLDDLGPGDAGGVGKPAPLDPRRPLDSARAEEPPRD